MIITVILHNSCIGDIYYSQLISLIWKEHAYNITSLPEKCHIHFLTENTTNKI
jgi:hypothetical protein